MSPNAGVFLDAFAMLHFAQPDAVSSARSRPPIVTNIVVPTIDAPVPLLWPEKPMAHAISRFFRSAFLRPACAAVRLRVWLRSTLKPDDTTG